MCVTHCVPQVPQPVEEDEEGLKAQREPNAEWSHSGRVQRQSAQVAVFHLQEIANDELSKDWPKKKFLRDLVPDDRKVRRSHGTHATTHTHEHTPQLSVGHTHPSVVCWSHTHEHTPQ